MSHIDSFRHEIVGLFAGLPVYHPLEDIDGEFRCTTAQLLLGGGSGEHPALLIRNPAGAVARFLHEELSALKGPGISTKQFPLREHLEAWGQVIEPHLDWSTAAHLEFFDWDIATASAFHERCRSPALANPWFEEDGGLEDWLILGFGEFVFFAMPELAMDIISKLDEPWQYFAHYRYSNILLIPPNFPVYANGGNAFISTRRSR